MSKLTHLKDAPIKICPSCKAYSLVYKEILQMWAKDPSRPDGLQTYCRACNRKKDQARYQKKKEWEGVERLRKWMQEGLEDPEETPLSPLDFQK